MTLTINHLVGGYSQVPVIKDVTFEVEDGQLVALIGLNGAGKSTTINHIIGLLTPQHGDVTIDGTSLMANPTLYKQKIAYVPEQPILYDELTLKEHLELTIMAYQLDDVIAWNKANKLLKLFRLENKLNWFPSNFSKGMKQKVMLVNAFMTEADVFIIDEPFIGLDPLAVHDLLGLITDVKQRGASVLMSTHVLDTAEKIADDFVLLHNGEVRANGTLTDLRELFPEAGTSLNDIYLTLAKEV